MRDFTLKIYEKLLIAFKQANYEFITFEEFCQTPSFLRKQELPDKEEIAVHTSASLGNQARNDKAKFIILRHDVDLKAENSLETAKIEHDLGMRASYYFRIVPQSNKPEIIRAIAALGHEIGYHYEDLSLFRGDLGQAIRHFEEKLAYFRQFYPVKTICMHGSPTSRFDNRNIWKTYDYHKFGIIGEPYFDVDFKQFLYLTDTGRCWNGERFSVRDKVDGAFRFNFKHTHEIINALKNNQLPDKLMITTHPQRWTDDFLLWSQEWLCQTAKNQVKYLLNKKREKTR